jgi:hypothetical protein
LEILQNPTRGRTCGFGDKVGRSPHCSRWMSHSLITDSISPSEQDRRPIAPALIAKLVATDAAGSPVAPSESDRILSRVDKPNNGTSYREIDPSFFVVMVDLWNENGAEERTRVLNHTPREKVQKDRRRQDTHDNRPQSVIYYLLPPMEPKITAFLEFWPSYQSTSISSRSSYL